MTTPSITNLYQKFKVAVPEAENIKDPPISNQYQNFRYTVDQISKQSPNDELIGTAGEGAENIETPETEYKDPDVATPKIEIIVKQSMARIDQSSSDIDTQNKMDNDRQKQNSSTRANNQVLENKQYIPLVWGGQGKKKEVSTANADDTTRSYVVAPPSKDAPFSDQQAFKNSDIYKQSKKKKQIDQFLDERNQKVKDKKQADDLAGALNFQDI
mgnify:CR=1 FL=1